MLGHLDAVSVVSRKQNTDDISRRGQPATTATMETEDKVDALIRGERQVNCAS